MKKLFIISGIFIATAISANAQVSFGAKAGANLSTAVVSMQGLNAEVNPGFATGAYVGGNAEISLGSKFYFQPELVYNYGGAKVAINDDFADFLNKIIFADPEDFKLSKASASITTHTFRLPLMAKFKTSDGLSLLAGPYVAYGMVSGVNADSILDIVFDGAPAEAREEAKEAINLYTDVIADNYVNLDFGASIGVEYEFSFGGFIEARYNHSFFNAVPKVLSPKVVNDLNKKNDETWTEADAIEDIDIIKEIGIMPTARRSSIQIGVGFRF